MTIATPAMTRRALVSGSLLPIWDDLLPDYPADIAEADARAVAATFSRRSEADSPRRTRHDRADLHSVALRGSPFRIGDGDPVFATLCRSSRLNGLGLAVARGVAGIGDTNQGVLRG